MTPPSPTPDPTGNAGSDITSARYGGEYLVIPERLVVAPVAGRFEPAGSEGVRIAIGDTLGVVVRSDERVPVVADVTGHLVGHLADRDQRVRDGQPVAWIRLAS